MDATCKTCGATFQAPQCHIKAGNSKGTLCQTCRPTRESRKCRISVRCAQCSAEVQVKPSVYQHAVEPKRFFCNWTCTALWRTTNAVRGEDHPNYTGKIDVHCEVCGAPKQVYPSQHKAYSFFLCSEQCRGIWHHENKKGSGAPDVEVPCVNCGGTKPVRPWMAELYRTHFCSPACRSAWQSMRWAGANNPTYNGGGFEARCNECGVLVHVKPSRANSDTHLCSKKCAHKYLRTRRGVKSPGWRGGNVKKFCKICGKQFEVKPAHHATGYYNCCSKTCAGLASRKEYTEVERTMMRINNVIGSSVAQSLRGLKNNRAWQSLVGYTIVQLKERLESLFAHGMGWDNYGIWRPGGPLRWHVDHIKPKSSFTFASAEDPQFRECWSISNLQPLWGPDNLSKSNKLGEYIQKVQFSA